jgi:hypothetical protein
MRCNTPVDREQRIVTFSSLDADKYDCLYYRSYEHTKTRFVVELKQSATVAVIADSRDLQKHNIRNTRHDKRVSEHGICVEVRQYLKILSNEA